MAQREIHCPHCNQALTIEADWIGMELECPLCSASFILQETTDTPTEKACPFCGNMIKYQATRCKFCKQAIPSIQQSSDEQQSSEAAGKQKCKFTKKKIIIISTSTVILAGILLTLGLKYYGVNEIAKAKLEMAKLILDPDYDSSEEECQREIENITAFYDSNAKFLSKENRNNIQETIEKLKIRKKEVAKIVPLDKLLLETDAPYMAPVPFRGKENEPAYVKFVAEEIANLRGISFEEVANATTANAKKLLKL